MSSNKELDPADLALLSLYHAHYNSDRGIQISDTDELVKLAESFHKKHANTNWEKLNWEEAIVKHYNLHAPIHWDKIT